MQTDAYGMFLVHYPIALWLQYWLFDYNLPATVKAPIGFVLTVAFSWALTRALRQIPARSGCCDGHRHSGAMRSIEPQMRTAHLRSGPSDHPERLTWPSRSCSPAASPRTPSLSSVRP